MTKLALDQIIFNYLRKNMMFIDQDYSDNKGEYFCCLNCYYPQPANEGRH